MAAPRILAFAGSVRRESFNRRLLSLAVAGAQSAGAEVTRLELADLPLPLFDQDAEARDGLPANARKLKDLMIAHQGFLMACPEYNRSITPLLKNALDWASRAVGTESGLLPYRYKVAALISASPGAYGAAFGLRQVRDLLLQLQCTVLPENFSLPGADTAFDASGRLKDEKRNQAVEAVGARLTDVLRHWS
ncbi:MAG: NAD(P)H-dependent oxidoreductase [Nevskiales bacterium]|nr:NAD(P)H-dependent oxidoreductase [Nevskiales bacterium]